MLLGVHWHWTNLEAQESPLVHHDLRLPSDPLAQKDLADRSLLGLPFDLKGPLVLDIHLAPASANRLFASPFITV